MLSHFTYIMFTKCWRNSKRCEISSFPFLQSIFTFHIFSTPGVGGTVGGVRYSSCLAPFCRAASGQCCTLIPTRRSLIHLFGPILLQWLAKIINQRHNPLLGICHMFSSFDFRVWRIVISVCSINNIDVHCTYFKDKMNRGVRCPRSC